MRTLMSILTVLALGACSGGGDATCDGAAPVALADVQASIFSPSCATSGCHTGGLPAEGLSLDDGKSFGGLVNVHAASDPSKLLVKPGDPGASLLYTQVQSGIMPQNAPPLSAAQVDQIRGWICAGAPSD